MLRCIVFPPASQVWNDVDIPCLYRYLKPGTCSLLLSIVEPGGIPCSTPPVRHGGMHGASLSISTAASNPVSPAAG